MDGKEAIISRIISDAENKANNIARISQELCDENLKEANEWADNYKKAQEEILDKDCENLITRRETLARLDKKKILLSSKRQVIDAVIEGVLNDLNKLPKEQYLKLVEKMIKEHAESGDTVVMAKNCILTEEDFKSTEVYKELKLSLSNKKGDFNGGVKLVNEICDKDLSFYALVNQMQEEIAQQVNNDLFKTE